VLLTGRVAGTANAIIAYCHGQEVNYFLKVQAQAKALSS
jgi:hypothetical protein